MRSLVPVLAVLALSTGCHQVTREEASFRACDCLHYNEGRRAAGECAGTQLRAWQVTPPTQACLDCLYTALCSELGTCTAACPVQDAGRRRDVVPVDALPPDDAGADVGTDAPDDLVRDVAADLVAEPDDAPGVIDAGSMD